MGKYNGMWDKGDKHIVIFRTVEDIIVHYRKVDDDGHKLGKIHKDLASEVLPGFIKKGSGRTYKD